VICVYEVAVTPNEEYGFRTLSGVENFRRSWYISTEELVPTKEAYRKN
jgi:hypothetical protein